MDTQMLVSCKFTDILNTQWKNTSMIQVCTASCIMYFPNSMTIRFPPTYYIHTTIHCHDLGIQKFKHLFIGLDRQQK